jgi:hypothetical protein
MFNKLMIWWHNREWPITINWFKHCHICHKLIIATRDDWRSHLCDFCDEHTPENHN